MLATLKFRFRILNVVWCVYYIYLYTKERAIFSPFFELIMKLKKNNAIKLCLHRKKYIFSISFALHFFYFGEAANMKQHKFVLLFFMLYLCAL
jgi:hypothetical protein